MSQRQEPSQTESEIDEDERADYDEIYSSIRRSNKDILNMLAAHKPGNINQYCYIVQVTGNNFQPTFRHILWNQRGNKTGYVLKIGFAQRGAGVIDRIIDHINDDDGKVRLIGLMKGVIIEDESRMKRHMQSFCVQTDLVLPPDRREYSHEWWVYDYTNVKNACVSMALAMEGAKASILAGDRDGSANLECIFASNPTRMTEGGLWFGRDARTVVSKQNHRLPMKLYMAKFSPGNKVVVPRQVGAKNNLAKDTKVGHYISLKDNETKKTYTSMINQIEFFTKGGAEYVRYLAQWDDPDHPERNTIHYVELISDFGRRWNVYYSEIDRSRVINKRYKGRGLSGVRVPVLPKPDEEAAAIARGEGGELPAPPATPPPRPPPPPAPRGDIPTDPLPTWKGRCPKCGKNVYSNQARVRPGGTDYWHTDCYLAEMEKRGRKRVKIKSLHTLIGNLKIG